MYECIFELPCIWTIWNVTDWRNKVQNFSNFVNSCKIVDAYNTAYVHQMTLRIQKYYGNLYLDFQFIQLSFGTNFDIIGFKPIIRRLISIDLCVAVRPTDRHTGKPNYSMTVWDLETEWCLRRKWNNKPLLKMTDRRIYRQIKKWVQNVQEFVLNVKRITRLHISLIERKLYLLLTGKLIKNRCRKTFECRLVDACLQRLAFPFRKE
jgi:hypothetical protein